MKTNLIKPLLLLIFISFGCTQNESKFKFVFMTDIHIQSKKNAEEGFLKALKKAEELEPDFILTGGDLIFDALGQNYDSAKVLYDLYNKLSAQTSIPIYNTIGNHEVFGLYKKSGVDESDESFGKKMFKDRIGEGKTYYSFDHKGWHFISLDAIGFTGDRKYYGLIDSLQMNWLDGDLKNVDSETPIVISIHIPLATIYGQMKFGSTYQLPEGAAVTNSKEVLEMFKDHNLKLVLQGHLHIVEEINFDGTSFITGGAVSGSWWNGPRENFEEGFVLVEVFENDFEWEYIDYNWEAVNNN
ncbi:MAG: metallophosphoesterase [Ignavibacteriae bacterium]|nr:metallophosphoesterase [Ignavibacteriota bacterium]